MSIVTKPAQYWHCEYCGDEWLPRDLTHPPPQCRGCKRRAWLTGIPEPKGPRTRKARVMKEKSGLIAPSHKKLTGSEVLRRLLAESRQQRESHGISG